MRNNKLGVGGIFLIVIEVLVVLVGIYFVLIFTHQEQFIEQYVKQFTG